jgi:hypothetical protein
MMRALSAIISGLLILGATGAQAQTLRGSASSMERQNAAARRNDFSFLRRATQVAKFADLGLLVKLPGNRHYELANVSYPYARPAVKTFVERLASQYQSACGDKLVVTSLTRPLSRQPSNASDLSVHPAGMAVDLRVSTNSRCRRWLEETLLYLEDQGSVDVTREYHPSHYHVAVFPDHYLKYVRSVDLGSSSSGATRVASAGTASSHAKGGDSGADTFDDYEIRRGDTLSELAQKFGTSVAELRSLNNIRGSRIVAGQKITVPVHARS